MASGREEPVRELTGKGSRGKITSCSLAGVGGAAALGKTERGGRQHLSRGFCKGMQRRERKQPIKATAGQPKGHVPQPERDSRRQSGRLSIPPSLHPSQAALGVPVDGKEHKEAQHRRAVSPRVIKPIKYVFPLPGPGTREGFFFAATNERGVADRGWCLFKRLLPRFGGP